MASVSRNAKGFCKVQFTGLDGQRRTLYLGKMEKKQAENVSRHVENILAAELSKSPLAKDTAVWLGDIVDRFHQKLVGVGLVNPRQPAEKPAAALIGPFIDGYLARRTDLKPASRFVLAHTIRNLKDFFGDDRPMESINAAEADDFARWMEVDEKLAPATIGKRIEWADTFFRDAVRRKLKSENPFEETKRSKRVNPERKRYISRETIATVIEAAPDAEWRLLIALSRYIGLRVPSEPFSLTWDDIDWQRSRIRITDVKNARYEGRGSRWAPILPEVRPYLDDVHEIYMASEDNDPYVLANLRRRGSMKSGSWADVNLRTLFTKIIRRAGFEPWPKLWHNLRASAQTDLARNHPLHVVCAWLGNSEAIADKHYLQITDADYERALMENSATTHMTTQSERSIVVMSGLTESNNAKNPLKQGVLAQGDDRSGI